LAYWRRIYRF